MSGVTGYDGSSGSRRWRAHTRAREIPPKPDNPSLPVTDDAEGGAHE
jgi:hypothetical protein